MFSFPISFNYGSYHLTFHLLICCVFFFYCFTSDCSYTTQLNSKFWETVIVRLVPTSMTWHRCIFILLFDCVFLPSDIKAYCFIVCCWFYIVKLTVYFFYDANSLHIFYDVSICCAWYIRGIIFFSNTSFLGLCTTDSYIIFVWLVSPQIKIIFPCFVMPYLPNPLA